MDQAKAGFVATVSFRGRPIEAKEPRGARAEFWRPIQESLPRSDADRQTIEALEAGLITAFPGALYDMLSEHFRALEAVFFRVSIEGYGSALLAVDVGGVRELAELVGGHLDTFTMLMEAFVPAAFAAVLPSSHDASHFVATIAPTAELERAFAQQRRRSSPAVPLPTNGRASGEGGARWLAQVPRALVATALSLLTPVVLALIVLYCAAQLLLDERSVLTKREALLASQEQDLRKSERAAAADLQKENVELLRLLHTTPGPVSRASSEDRSPAH